MKFFQNKCCICWAVIIVRGSASIHFVKVVHCYCHNFDLSLCLGERIEYVHCPSSEGPKRKNGVQLL